MDDVEERDKLVVISHPRETNLDFGRAQQINNWRFLERHELSPAVKYQKIANCFGQCGEK